jgi:hypothetical protein
MTLVTPKAAAELELLLNKLVSGLLLVLSYIACRQRITRGLNLGVKTKQIIVPVRLFV